MAEQRSGASNVSGQATSTDGSAFKAEALRVMTALCRSFARVIESCKGGPRATDLTITLGLDKSLAWHIMCLAKAEDPLTSGEHVPGEEGVQIFIQAASSKGADPQSISELRLAVKEFQQMRSAHAGGDRQALLAMLSSVGQNKSEAWRAVASARKTAFKSNAAIFGVSAKVQFQIDFTCPSDLEALVPTGTLDFCTLRGVVGLTRLRNDAAWMLGQTGMQDSSKQDLSSGCAKPLDDAAQKIYNAPLVQRFCLGDIKPFRTSKDAHGNTALYAAEGDIGRSGSIDLTLGEYTRNVGSVIALPNDPQPDGEVFCRLYTPTEAFVQLWLVHKRLARGVWQNSLPPSHMLLSELGGGSLHPRGYRFKPTLPQRPGPESLGPADKIFGFEDVPNLESMLKWAASQMNWNLADFDAYGIRAIHPPIPTTSVMRIKLPDKAQ